ncbi:hypothetical protein IJT17_08460, partial [bacterium]|nr:hypothetical protein [bacterium]
MKYTYMAQLDDIALKTKFTFLLSLPYFSNGSDSNARQACQRCTCLRAIRTFLSASELSVTMNG